ncbi:FecR family protein [Butyricimonas sp. Marseille-P3923]|uniref:FecR family protein n=1 Tax=Butyricimonas sp. Marseille-P3923 TaxID=1987504 RepID=UPI000C088889|nr:FecR domain-containing protein [Butyricimonas sp. Marseille-P3923]
MENEFSYIIELFRKSYGGILTPGEREELERLLENEQLRHVWEELERGDLARESVRNGDLFSCQRGFSEFKRLRKVRKYRKLRQYVAIGVSAAAILLAVNMVFTWLPSLKKNVKQNLFATVPDIFPERNKAYLLLGSGDTVRVTGDKKVFQDKNGAQIKYDNGALAYSAGEEPEEAVYNTLMVPVGGESMVTLADGSKVWLNADTRLRYPTHFTGDERRVELEGEAYFEVKPGSSPFIVHTSEGDVRVLGTSFGVRFFEKEGMLTTLVSGKVFYRGRDSVVLEPGEQVVVTVTGEVRKREVDVDEYVGWKNGTYVFDRRSLEEIMRDLERWYGVKVVFVQPELGALPFTGYIKRYDKINTFLKLLESTGELSYKIEGKNIMLYKK